MLLGDIIADLADDATAAETILRVGDVTLLARLQAHCDRSGVSLGTLATWAARRYSDAAPADEWTTLLGAMERTSDPGSAWLRRAFLFAAQETGRDGP
jgi:hypothetical protein